MTCRKFTEMKSNGSEKALLCMAIAAGSLLSIGQLPGLAGTGVSTYYNTSAAPAARAGVPDPRKVYHGPEGKVIRVAEELPDMPRYTSRAYFLGGCNYPADAETHHRTIQMRYAVHEPKEQVLNWYRDALNSYSWNVTASKTDPNELLASKGSNHCLVTVAPAKGPWFASTITIDYKLGQ